MADDIRSKHPNLGEQTSRQKARSIAKYLRANNLTGLKDLRQYHDLQNSFLGISLHDAEHPSLPLVSTAIYCCVAKRLGLEAYACGFPFHVYTIVSSPRGFDLDGNGMPLESSDLKMIMYMDPFQSDQETPVANLQAQLRTLGFPDASHTHTLARATTSEIVLRTGRNILASVQDAHRAAVARHGHGGNDHVTLMSSFPDMEGAFYAALWASLLLGIPADGDGATVATVPRRNFLPRIVEHFETHFPGDVSLIDEYIVPLFREFGEYTQLRETVRVSRAGDSMPKSIKSRNKETIYRVRYKVGQVFQHKRYNYVAVITGWDVECAANEHWMTQMRVHELPQGKHQSFYHVL